MRSFLIRHDKLLLILVLKRVTSLFRQLWITLDALILLSIMLEYLGMIVNFYFNGFTANNLYIKMTKCQSVFLLVA